MTLPSDSSQKMYPNNTVTHYYTHLSRPVDLQGTWQVGLAEISFPHSWHTIRRQHKMSWTIKVPGRPSKKYVLPPGIYHSAEEVIERMNEIMKHKFTPEEIEERKRNAEKVDHIDVVDYDIHFGFDRISRTATVTFNTPESLRETDLVRLKINRNLVRLLGLPRELSGTCLGPGVYAGTHTVDLTQGFHALHVYCDLVNHRHVGDILSPLLRHVPFSLHVRRDDYTETQVFNPVYFMSLQRNNFNTVEIDIRDDVGEPVPFESRKVVVTLVFRKIAP